MGDIQETALRRVLQQLGREAGLKEWIEDSFKEGFKKGFEEGFKDGLKKGAEEGERQRMMETARRMLDAGMYARKEVVTISGLSLETVKELEASKGL